MYSYSNYTHRTEINANQNQGNSSNSVLNGHRVWTVFEPIDCYAHIWKYAQKTKFVKTFMTPVVDDSMIALISLAQNPTPLKKLNSDVLPVILSCIRKCAINPVECEKALLPSLKERKWTLNESSVLAQLTYHFSKYRSDFNQQDLAIVDDLCDIWKTLKS